MVVLFDMARVGDIADVDPECLLLRVGWDGKWWLHGECVPEG